MTFCPKPAVFQQIYMIKAEEKEDLQSILKQYPIVFRGIGKLKQHQVKLHVDSTVVHVACPARSVPYHLRDRVDEAIDEMIAHPNNNPDVEMTEEERAELIPRRSIRHIIPNQTIFNENFVHS